MLFTASFKYAGLVLKTGMITDITSINIFNLKL